MNTQDGYVIQLYHLFILLGGICGIFGLFYRTWIMPVKEWRRNVEKQISDNKHEYELFKTKSESDSDNIKSALSRGEKQFTELKNEISEVKDCLKSIEQTITKHAASIQHYMENHRGG